MRRYKIEDIINLFIQTYIRNRSHPASDFTNRSMACIIMFYFRIDNNIAIECYKFLQVLYVKFRIK